MYYHSTIKEYIEKYAGSDTDYWISGGGDLYIISRLKTLSDENWKYLKEDLINWNLNEIEILALVLSGYEYKKSDNILNKSCHLFIHIFISIDINSSFDMLDDIEFILQCDNLELEYFEKIIHRLEELKKHPSFDLFYSTNRIKEFEIKLNQKIISKLESE